MAEPLVLEIEEGLSLKLPPDVAQSLHLKKGSKVFVRESEGRIILTPEEQEKLEQFRHAVEKVRENVRKAGGITAREIEDAVRKVRTAKSRS